MDDRTTRNEDIQARYARQMIFPPLGEAGQAKLGEGRALIVGTGALGSQAALWLVRAGVGSVRLVDPDVVATINLHRQILFDEDDVAAESPKVLAAARRLAGYREPLASYYLSRTSGNDCEIVAPSGTRIEPIDALADASNIDELCQGIDVIVDGTDNFAARLVINEAAVRHSLPYVFGGALAADGQVMVILPGETPCLECLFGDRATTENQPNCVVAGILGPTVGVIASLQAMEAVKILSGNIDAVSRHLTVVSLWENRIRRLDVAHLRSVDCPVCGAR